MWARLLGSLATLSLVASAAAEPEATLPDTDDAELLAVAHAADAWRDEHIEAVPPRRKRSRRFSNGPRSVPVPRGAALQRATELGIGSLDATRKLLRGAPSPELLAAARGSTPHDLLWPVPGGRWGRGFGYTRKHNQELRHNGVDIGAPEGTVVRAAADGIVVYSDNTLPGYGNAVIVLHPNGWTTLYAHNSRNTVQAGWRVKRAERIALVGATGIAWGPHLHFELRHAGKLLDPKSYLVERGSELIEGPLVALPSEPRAH